MRIKPKVLILFALSLFLVSCSPVKDSNNSKKLEKVVSEEQINLHFKLKNKE